MIPCLMTFECGDMGVEATPLILFLSFPNRWRISIGDMNFSNLNGCPFDEAWVWKNAQAANMLSISHFAPLSFAGHLFLRCY